MSRIVKADEKLFKKLNIKMCYLFDCPCCVQCHCTISYEELLYLHNKYNTNCIARKDDGNFWDFQNSAILNEFKEFHNSLQILQKLKS